MALKFEIIGNNLVVTDTADNSVKLERPSADVFGVCEAGKFKIFTRTSRNDVVLEGDYTSLINSAGSALDATSLRSFFRSNLGFSKAGSSALTTLPSVIGTLSWRGFSNLNNGFPAFKLGGQAIGRSYPKNICGKAINGWKLVMVGAYTWPEVDASGGTIQALVEYPVGSGTTYPITFSGLSEGTIPTAWPKILESDVVPFNWLPDTEAFIAMSGAGVIPCTYVGDWASTSKTNGRDLFIQIGSSNKAAMQVNNLTLNQIKNMRQVPTSRAITEASWSSANGGQLTLRVWGHGLSSSVGVKALVRASIGGQTSIDGLYTLSTSGPDQIIIPMATDPTSGGTVPITDFGLVEFWSMPTGFNIAVNNGVATVTHTAHGRAAGHWWTYTGFSAIGWNKDWEIDTIVDANTYTFKVPAGLIAPTTYGAITNTYGVSTITSQYGLRPYGVVGLTDTDCQFVVCNSVNTTVDIISDNTYQAGLARRLMGPVPTLDGSQNNDALYRWIAGMDTDHSIRRELASRYCSSFFLGPWRNDYGNWSETTWTGLRDLYYSLLQYEPFKTWAAHGKNSILLDIAPNTSSEDEFSSLDKQNVWANDAGRQKFNEFLRSQVGSVFNRLFDYAGLIEPFGQPGKFNIHPRARQVKASITAGSSLITFDPDTPIDKLDDGLCIAIRGAGASGSDGTTMLVGLRYRSPTTAIACFSTQLRLPFTATSTVVSAVAYVGARHLVQKNSTNSTIHEGQAAFELAQRTIGLKK